jgi:hypothetical protein
MDQMNDKYTHETYKIADIFLPGGRYTLDELRGFIALVEQNNARVEEALKRSMQMAKEDFSAARTYQK